MKHRTLQVFIRTNKATMLYC